MGVRGTDRIMLALALLALPLMAAAPPAEATATSPAEVAAYPQPRAEEWFFTSWEVQSRIWPTTQGEGVTVAVLDTGVQADMPQLKGAVLPGIEISADGFEGGDGRTDKDDAAVPGHGTAMAGLIAGQGGPTHFVGLAPRAKILPVTAHSSAAAMAPAIRWAVDHDADVISISQVTSWPCPDDVQEAVVYALDHDVPVVAGAGNSGQKGNQTQSPANCLGVLAVGAVGYAGDKFLALPITEQQPYVTVGAPGTIGGVLLDGQYHTSQSGGTSPATALTSATIALIRAKYPDMPAREVVRRVIATCLDVGKPGKDNQTGYGLIRPSRAVQDKVPRHTPNPVFAAYDKWKAAHNPAKKLSPAAGAADNTRSVPPPVVMLAGVTIIAVIVIVVVALARRVRRRPRSF